MVNYRQYVLNHTIMFLSSQDFHLELKFCDCEVAKAYRKENGLPEPDEETLQSLREFREEERKRNADKSRTC
jgi:hypothetical protein